MINKIVQLEEQIKQFKTSQLLGSSSARIIPIYEIDMSATIGLAAWLSWRFTTDKAINPIIMPRLEVRLDGNLVDYNSNDYVALFYDDYYAAINFRDATGTWKLPDEHMTSFSLRIMPYDWSVPSHTLTIKGTVYGVAEGKMEYCILQ